MLRSRGTEDVVGTPEAVPVATDAPEEGPLEQERQRDADHGRDAASPRQLPRAAWMDVLKRTRLAMKSDQVPLLAAGSAFFGLLALIPALVAVVSIYGLVSNPSDVQRQVADLTGSLPDSARALLEEQLSGIVDSSSSGLGLAAVIGIVLALWSASSGVGHLVDSVNVAYDEPEGRGPVKLKLMALGLTLGGIVFLVVAVGLIAVLPAAVDRLGLDGAAATALTLLRWPLLVVAFVAALSVLYRVGPDRSPARWRWVTWGAGVATVIWVLGSAVFSLYVENFGSFNETYGSLAGVIVLMLWLYLTMTVILLGAELNSELERQTRVDSTTGEPQPLGRRGAVAADTVAEDADGHAAGPEPRGAQVLAAESPGR